MVEIPPLLLDPRVRADLGAFIFPGVGLGAIRVRARAVGDEMFTDAAARDIPAAIERKVWQPRYPGWCREQAAENAWRLVFWPECCVLRRLRLY